MDYKMFRAINRLAGRYSVMDELMIWISNRVRYVYIFLLVFMWFRDYSSKKASRHAGVSALLSLFIHGFIKRVYFKPRPFVKRRVGILIPSKRDSSFPSKHTILVFAVSTSVLLRERMLGAFMWGLSVLTGLSRIWVGHHYPSDIVGSALIGSAASVVVDKNSRFFDALVYRVMDMFNKRIP
ncbi:undecaprenyl-diphosphatase [Bacillus songklensis]|uniref:Undecaprenyl-diphosphatase n=1 Tax=Bacillus songklensis TaxID=1069116 RepID=A0ABV8B630_9BACI